VVDGSYVSVLLGQVLHIDYRGHKINQLTTLVATIFHERKEI
jgi:hypothetical protein